MSNETRGFWEDGYRITWRPDARMLREALALRADVFCRELRWVGRPSDRLERDAFDAHATSIVVLDAASAVVATVRLIDGNRPWMLDGPFRGLLPEHVAPRRAGAMEASRLAVSRDARAIRLRSGRRVAELLFKAAWIVSRLNGVGRLYLVASRAVSRRLTSAGLPCVPLAPPTRMPDGVDAVPILLDWERLGAEAPVRSWFDDGMDARPRAPRRREDLGAPIAARADIVAGDRGERVVRGWVPAHAVRTVTGRR